MTKKLFVALSAALFASGSIYAFCQTEYDRLPTRQDSYIEEGSVSRSANPQQLSSVRDRLPRTNLGPAVGQAGDLVSKGILATSRQRPQQHPKGAAAISTVRADSESQGTVSSMLPPVRSSPYVDGYGDHVRSDLGMHINGTPYKKPVLHSSGVIQQAKQQQQLGVFKYGDPLTPPYKRSH